jgi:transposase
MERTGGELRLQVRYRGEVRCPGCGSVRLRTKDSYRRRVRHESWGSRQCVLELECHKWKCRECGRQFRSRFPGIQPFQRATEAFRRQIFQQHWDGISRSRLAKREKLGAATVERYFEYFLSRQAAEVEGASCPRVLGIDEHFFSRKHGYATTFCDLAKHKVYDVVLGRSEAALEQYLSHLKGKDKVRVVCMDLSSTYRSIVRKHFPGAVIVADRFHVIRLILHQFLAVWRLLDPAGANNRGLLSLLRRHAANLKPEQRVRLDSYLQEHPAVAVLYQVREQLCQLLLVRHRNARACRPMAHTLLQLIGQLRVCGFAALETLGETLDSWKNEIARMWRFTRNNGITEGFHTKMEVLQRQAYGFRNFRNYRLRVVVMCC